MEKSLSPVVKTALGVALIRAYESGQTDRLFDDPYAAAFAVAAVEAFVEEQADQGYLALGGTVRLPCGGAHEVF
jgi:O-methyltransferase involved in polyketide biosynthesis